LLVEISLEEVTTDGSVVKEIKDLKEKEMSVANRTNVKLGRHKPEAGMLKKLPRIMDYLDKKRLPIIPTATERGSKVKSWGMMLNDQIGNCTFAAAGHLIMGWSSMIGKPKTITDKQILKGYEDVSGYRPGNPNSDTGCVETDVLDYWMKTGIGGDKILAYGIVNTKNISEVQAAAYMFGGVYLGISLPATAENQDIWKLIKTSGDGEPGSWGGHAVPIIGYSKKTITVITWGARLMMNYDFFAEYCDEAYVVLSQDWLLNGKCPAGFDLATLQQDLYLLDK
jgi:hypothetical protein